VETLQITGAFYQAASPFILLSCFAMLAILMAASKSTRSPTTVFVLGNVSLAVTLGLLLGYVEVGEFLGGALVLSQLTIFLQALLLGFAWLLLLLTYFSHLRSNFFRPELLAVYFFVLLGMMVFCASYDLITLFVGLELSSIGLYTLVAYTRESRFSIEGGIKYLVLGSFASALLLFGFAFLYACTGTMELGEMVRQLASAKPSLWLLLGAAFTVFALGFKLALVPFQQWSPDAYEAAATNVTAFMTICVKIMVLSLLIKVLLLANEMFAAYWVYLLSTMAIASMLFGNIMALIQTSVKRMLAYSSIAHSGYMAIALSVMAPQNTLPNQALLFYLVSYALCSLLVFGVVLALEHKESDNIQLQDLKGLAQSRPWLAFALTTGMISFAGLPPTVGFIGKFFVFNAALKEGALGIVLCAVAASLISLFYYLRVPVMMYMHKPSAFVQENRTRVAAFPAGILACTWLAIIALGTVLPQVLFSLLKVL
jgi:NADH-quinone oxidoreductase subunit N